MDLSAYNKYVNFGNEFGYLTKYPTSLLLVNDLYEVGYVSKAITETVGEDNRKMAEAILSGTFKVLGYLPVTHFVVGFLNVVSGGCSAQKDMSMGARLIGRGIAEMAGFTILLAIIDVAATAFQYHSLQKPSEEAPGTEMLPMRSPVPAGLPTVQQRIVQGGWDKR